MRPSRRWALALAGLALAFGLLESGLRVHARSLQEYPRRGALLATDDPGDIVAVSAAPALGYELYRDMDVIFKGKRFTTDSHGLRGPERTLRKPSGSFRIAVLGDSVAMGWRVGQDETYAAVLEKDLNARSAGRRVEVLDFGVNGYNVVQEFITLRDKALAFAPDLVVWGYVGNDLEPQPNKRGRLWLRTPSYAVGFAVLRLQNLLGGTEPGLTYDWRPDPGGAAPEDFAAAFEAIMRLCRERGIPVLMALDSRYVNPLAPHGVLAARARALGAQTIDLFKLYRRLPESVSISEAVTVPDEHNRLYVFERGLGKDNHPNARWHARTAGVILAKILEEGYLGGAEPRPGVPRFAGVGLRDISQSQAQKTCEPTAAAHTNQSSRPTAVSATIR